MVDVPSKLYGTPGARRRFVDQAHALGLGVILDVVDNHTVKGNQLGPTLCFRGIDNAAYYRLMADDRRDYMDYTGCGNTLNMPHPCTLQLIMDSLRYWVLEMHVDGFRFDLASTLARELHKVNRLGAFFDIIHQDPVLSQVKLIAEPWDLGEGGYQVGNFPILWAEWNAAYRDTVHRFWKGDGNQVGGLAFRLTGSSDLYERVRGAEVQDLVGFRPDGQEMSNDDWHNPQACWRGLRLAGDAIEEVDARGHRIVDDTLLLLLNAHHEPVTFILPAYQPSARWEVGLDTRHSTGKHQLRFVSGGKLYELGARSLALFRHRDKPVQRGA